MMSPEELWMPVKGFEHYEVSNLGRIRKISYLRAYSSKGTVYPAVQLFETDGHGKRRIGTQDKGKYKKFFLHRLLAEAFIPNPENKPHVNHKDGNKMNFDLANLEWATFSENMLHAYATGLNKGGKSQQNRMVIETTEAYEIIKIWKGIRELKESGRTWNKIYDSIKRKVLYRGNRWFYLNYNYDYSKKLYFKKQGKEKIIVNLAEIIASTEAEYLEYIKQK